MLRTLAEMEGIKTVTPGVIGTGKGRCESLVLRVTTRTIGGYKLIARKGRKTQEIFLVTHKDSTCLKEYINKILNK
ncbi:DUF2103 domain-containing protein [Prochlorococcus sp. MIT 1341]|uniref:DUF2103 domain-containing protein n=1 Tax=Prochlorococcus sp. MIT 1341 TaxID=3096221 RepID=UPI002A7487BA|nr:DUF2103 domain-containing protein [Prochlorococcus sp. MIT 1341]